MACTLELTQFQARGFEIIGQPAIGPGDTFAASFQGCLELGGRNVLVLLQDFLAQRRSNRHIQMIQEVERHALAAHEGRLENRAGLGALGDPVVCLAAYLRAAVAEKGCNHPVLTMRNECVRDEFADAAPLRHGHQVFLRSCGCNLDEVVVGQRRRVFQHRSRDRDLIHGELARRASQRKRRLGEHPRDFRARLGLQVGDDGNRNFIEGRAVREGLHAGVASQHVRDLSQEIATPLARRLLGEIQQQSKFRCRSGHEAYGSCV
jgi:hypothetical protein